MVPPELRRGGVQCADSGSGDRHDRDVRLWLDDSSGYRTIRKVGVVDSSTSFDLDTYDCDGNQFAADMNTHASMLLELRWVDEDRRKTDMEPTPNVEFGVPMGYFGNTMAESPAASSIPRRTERDSSIGIRT